MPLWMIRPCVRLRLAGPLRWDLAPGLADGTPGSNGARSVSQAVSRREPLWRGTRATSGRQKNRSGYWHVVWTLDWFVSVQQFSYLETSFLKTLYKAQRDLPGSGSGWRDQLTVALLLRSSPWHSRLLHCSMRGSLCLSSRYSSLSM